VGLRSSRVDLRCGTLAAERRVSVVHAVCWSVAATSASEASDVAAEAIRQRGRARERSFRQMRGEGTPG